MFDVIPEGLPVDASHPDNETVEVVSDTEIEALIKDVDPRALVEEEDI